ncbi:MAG: AAA family ATPase, partial [Anaerolineae bacterium]
LCFLFWPDTPESTARRNLSHLLTHLRRALPDPEVLLASDDRIGLDPHRAWSDAAAFERLCSKALQQAADLHRGPFLAGFSLPGCAEFEAWAAQEQRAFEQLYLKALTVLLEERTAGGEYEAAIACALRYLETDDLAEDVHRRLIELYAAAGDRSAALRQFERCAAALERELGVSPLPQTRAVYQAVLEDQPPPRPVARPAWMTLPGLDVPLVGRDEVVRRLEQAYGRAQAGHGGVVLISGEAGIGKSRLMQDFATRLEDQTLVLIGVGHPEAQTTPYQPIIQALRSTFHVSRFTFHIQPVWLAEASRLLPELRTMYPDLPSPLPGEPDEARSRLFEALCQIVLRLATSPLLPGSPAPLLLCLDDLHWADGATLDWLAYLGRHIRGSRGSPSGCPLLVIGTYRSEDADAVAELRQGLARLGVLSELRLSGLDTAAVLQLLRHLLGSIPADETLAGRLQRATGGNPFFLLETLRVLIEYGQPLEKLVSLADLPMPDTVREAVEARLARLSPVARQVLEAGAILSPIFGFDLVHLTAGRRELETMDGLDELVARQLLVEHGPSYRFQHELVRRAVEATVSPVRRQLLHRRAGRALEQLEPDAVGALVHHFDAGGEVEKALHYHALAAQQAEVLFAWGEAGEHQSRMLALLDRLDPDCTQPGCLAKRGQVLTARAHQRFLQGRLAERDADLAALTALAEASGDENLRLQALIHRARYLNLDAQYEKAIAIAEEGLALADRLHDELARSRLLAQIGFAHYFLGQPQAALTALESALAVAGEDATPDMRGRITHILGYVYFHLGNYARSLAYQQEAYVCHQQTGDHNRVAWDGLDIGAVHLEMGQFAEARQYLTEGLALARRIGARPAEAYGVILLGCWELHRGDYTVAANRFQQALSMQQELRSVHG